MLDEYNQLEAEDLTSYPIFHMAEDAFLRQQHSKNLINLNFFFSYKSRNINKLQ